MRCVAMQCEYSAVDHWVAPKPICGAPAERFAIILPRQGPAERLRPLVMALVGAVDLGRDRQLVVARCADIKIDYPPILKPGVRIDPQIGLITRKVAPQKGARHLRLERVWGVHAAGKIEIPSRPHDVVDPRGQPVALFPVEPKVE